jgi:hypothetical protein
MVLYKFAKSILVKFKTRAAAIKSTASYFNELGKPKSIIIARHSINPCIRDTHTLLPSLFF